MKAKLINSCMSPQRDFYNNNPANIEMHMPSKFGQTTPSDFLCAYPPCIPCCIG